MKAFVGPSRTLREPELVDVLKQDPGWTGLSQANANGSGRDVGLLAAAGGRLIPYTLLRVARDR